MGATVMRSSRAWYREPWPWILMSGPGIVVIAGLITGWIAATHQDALVADDYYKQGLAINRTLAKQESAAALKMRASATFSTSAPSVSVALHGDQQPARLQLRLAHATRPGVDQIVGLIRSDGGVYRGELSAMPVPGKWIVHLEDDAAAWRITGVWQQGVETTVTLQAQ